MKMFAWFWAILSLTTLFGCGTTQVVDACPEPIPIPEPTAAMVSCETALSELPENFGDLPVREAVAILSTNHVIDATWFFECARKHSELTRWIEEGR